MNLSQKSSLSEKCDATSSTFNLSAVTNLVEFTSHKILFVYEIPPSTCNDFFNIKKVDYFNAESTFVYDFGSHTVINCSFPIKFKLLQTCRSLNYLDFMASLSVKDSRDNLIDCSILNELKKSCLSLAIINESGAILQDERFSFCQIELQEELCFKVNEFIYRDHLSELLSSTGSLIIRIELFGSLAINKRSIDGAGYDSKIESNSQHELIRQLLRDEDYNSFLRYQGSNNNFTNATLNINDTSSFGNVLKIPVHAVLLAAHSEYFREILEDTSEVVVDELNSFSALVMLDYIYSGEIHSNDLETLVTLAKIGEDFKIIGLKDKCIRDILTLLFNIVHEAHFVALYKIGLNLRSSVIIEQVEQMYQRLNNNIYGPCDLSTFVEETLLNLGACENNAERIKIKELLGSISESSELKISSLVDLPADQVNFLGTVWNAGIGYFLVLNSNTCEVLENACDHLDYFDSTFSLVHELNNSSNGSIEFYNHGGSRISLRVRALRDENCLDVDNKRKNISQEMELKIIVTASVYDSLGRILTVSHTEGVSTDDMMKWDINSFLNKDILNQRENQSEIFLSLSFKNFSIQSSSTQIRPHCKELEKYGSSFLSKVYADPFRTRLLKLYENQEFTDVKIHLVDDLKNIVKTFYAHAVILSAISEGFYDAFSAENELSLSLSLYSPKTFEKLLKYMYGGYEELKLNEVGEILEVLCAAQELKINGLSDDCIRLLLTFELDLVTAMHLYKIGVGIKSMTLKKKTIDYFLKNYSSVAHLNEFCDFVKNFPKLQQHLDLFIE